MRRKEGPTGAVGRDMLGADRAPAAPTWETVGQTGQEGSLPSGACILVGATVTGK